MAADGEVGAPGSRESADEHGVQSGPAGVPANLVLYLSGGLLYPLEVGELLLKPLECC